MLASVVSFCCFTDVRNRESFSDTRDWILSCAEVRLRPEHRMLSEHFAALSSLSHKKVEQYRFALITGSLQKPRVNYYTDLGPIPVHLL